VSGLLLSAGARAQSPPAGQKFKLSKIEVTGLQHTALEEVIAASGLQTGQQVDEGVLDEAAGRLLQTGLFTKLSYRYRTTGDEAVVTFIVEEARGSLPVVFDNFIWFSRDELTSAVRRELPSFEGTAPESQGAIKLITKALTDLLAARHIGGEVEYITATDESGAHPRHVFSVRGVRVPLCQLHFPGAEQVSESELIKNSKLLFETDYSQETAAAFAVNSLLPLYHQRGHLRARFSEPRATANDADAKANCKGGADVAIPVAEGLAYLWDKAEWTGADALTVAELDAALNMKAGEVADGLKIEAGARAIHKAYGRKGYLDLRLKSAPTFDDANRRVSYRIQLEQGAQFHMGTITVAGLSDAEAARVARAWPLAPGAVFNMDAIEEFGKKLPALRLEGYGTRFKGVRTEFKPNRQTQMVDVTLNFK
jgi:outer membrane protein insertion porin family